MLASRFAVFLLSLSNVESFRLRRSGRNSSMLNDDIDPASHITCPVMNAFVQNGDLKTNGATVDAKSMLNALFRTGMNQPKSEGFAPGISQSNAFEYTFGVFLKNQAAQYRDNDGDLTLPIYNFPGTTHEHNSHTGITTQKGIPFDYDQWDLLAARADRKLETGEDCFSRDAWAEAMFFFESRNYNLTGTSKIDNSKVRSDHPIFGESTYVIGRTLSKGAKDGNALGGKRLVAGVSQVFNGMVNLFWTGDYGNLELYKARAMLAETDKGKTGLSFPWLDENFCLPVEELKSLLVNGTYPKSSGFAAMTEEEYNNKGEVWKFPKSRCTASYFQERAKHNKSDACKDNGEPQTVSKSVVAGRAKRTAFLATFGKKFWRR